MTAIRKSVFSTHRLPAEEKLDAWRDGISAVFDIRESLRTPPGGFDSRLTSHLLNDQIMLSRCETGSQKFERGPLRPANDGLDHYLIQTHLRGSQEVRRGQRRAEAGPGDLLIIDLAERHEAATTDFTHLTLTVPRPLLAPYLRRPDSQEGRVLKAGAPLTDMAVAHLKMLAGMADGMSQAEGTLAVEPTLALMASALNGSARKVEAGAAATAASLLYRVKAKIEHNLRNNELSIAGLCAAAGMSRASLYRLFEPYGGVRAYVQERRLRRAAEELASPAAAGLFIYDVAFNWGFASEAHFSRAFKARFGITPKGARDMGRAGLRLRTAAPDLLRVGDRDYEVWLSETLRSRDEML